MIHRPSPSRLNPLRVPRFAAAWLSLPIGTGARVSLARVSIALARLSLATLALACTLLGLAACSGDDQPDGSFRVERTLGTRSERVEPGRAPNDAASRTANPGARSGPAPAGSTSAGNGAGLVWTMPAAFVREAVPAAFSGLYLDFCRAPKQDAETHDGIVVSSVIAGTIEANLERWKGQFAGGKVVREGGFELPVANGAPLRGALLEIEGPTYAMRGSLWTEGPPSPIRAIFAAIEGPSGLLTLRYVGPPAGGERAATPFRALLDSVRRADASGGGGGE